MPKEKQSDDDLALMRLIFGIVLELNIVLGKFDSRHLLLGQGLFLLASAGVVSWSTDGIEIVLVLERGLQTSGILGFRDEQSLMVGLVGFGFLAQSVRATKKRRSGSLTSSSK